MKNCSFNNFNRVLLIFAFCFTGQLISSAQTDSTKVFQIITTDGNEYSGYIIEMNETAVKLKSFALGIISLKKADIKKITEVQKDMMVGDEVWMDNPQSTRYFVGPSSYGLKKGESYYQNTWIFFNQFATGLSDNFSIGVGTVPLFLFGGYSTPVWITPKFSFADKNEKGGFAMGGLFGTIIGEDESSFGVVYGTATLGSRDNNVTIGLGYGFSSDGFAESPTVNISGIARTGKRSYILGEAYVISTGYETNAFMGLGGRTVWNSISLDYGGAIPLSGGEFGVFPWLGISKTLGK